MGEKRTKSIDMLYEIKNNFLNYKLNDDFDNYCSKFFR